MNDEHLPEHRSDLISTFLAHTAWADATSTPLAGDASNRRYLRITGATGAAVLMDAPPHRGEDVRPFIAVTEWLRSQGLSAPEIYASDPSKGFLLIEDLGDDLYARHLERTPTDEETLYSAAVDLLLMTAELPVPGSIGVVGLPLQPYDMEVLAREAALLIEWWLPAATGTATPSDLDAEYRELIRDHLSDISTARQVLVQRDYHAENLLWLPERDGHTRVGLLDYQDALAGHAAYDLVSLLEDARRDTSADLQETMLRRYIFARPGLNDAEFRRDYALLGAQRNLKIIGIFARLWLRDGKAGYLDLIPRVWGHLMKDLAHPELASLRAWVAQHVPAPEPSVLEQIRRVPAA